MDSDPPLHTVLPIRAGEEKHAARCLDSLKETADYPIALEIIYGGIEPLPDLEEKHKDILYSTITVEKPFSHVTLANYAIFWRDLGSPMLRVDPRIQFLDRGWLREWVTTLTKKLSAIAIIQLRPQWYAIDGLEPESQFCNWILSVPGYVQLLSPVALDPCGMYFDAFTDPDDNDLYGSAEYNIRAKGCRDNAEMQVWSDVRTKYLFHDEPRTAMPNSPLLYYRSQCVEARLSTNRIQNEVNHGLYERKVLSCA